MITSDTTRYETREIEVTHYRTTDKRGYEVEVWEFCQDEFGSSSITAYGFRVRKDGTTYDRRQCVLVEIPAEVAAVLR